MSSNRIGTPYINMNKIKRKLGNFIMSRNGNLFYLAKGQIVQTSSHDHEKEGKASLMGNNLL